MRVGVGEGVVETRDHWWWRPWWTPGTRTLFFYLTFPGGDLAAATSGLRATLRPVEALDVLADADLHVTLRWIGPEAEMPDAALARVVDAVFAKASGLAAGPLSFDTALVVDEGVLMPTSAPWLTELDALQRDAIAEHVGRRDESSTWTHASLAYAHGAASAADVAGRLAPAASELGTLSARPTLEAVSLARNGRRYVWRTLAALPL